MKIELWAILLFWYGPYLLLGACWLIRWLRRPTARVPTHGMVKTDP